MVPLRLRIDFSVTVWHERHVKGGAVKYTKNWYNLINYLINSNQFRLHYTQYWVKFLQTIMHVNFLPFTRENFTKACITVNAIMIHVSTTMSTSMVANNFESHVVLSIMD